jgi:hypothetical protein
MGAVIPEIRDLINSFRDYSIPIVYILIYHLVTMGF